MAFIDETLTVMGLDPYRRLARAKYDEERMAAERNVSRMRMGLPGVGGVREPGGAGISWMEPQNRGQVRDFEGEGAQQAAFVARYGMSPQDILEGYRVGNILAETEPAPGIGGAAAKPRPGAASQPAAGQAPAPAAKSAPGTALPSLRSAALGSSTQGEFAGFKSGLRDIPTPETLAGSFDVGQRFNRSTAPDDINITPGQRAKAARVQRMTEAPIALTEAKAQSEQAKGAAATAKTEAAKTAPAKLTEAQKAVDRAYGKDYAAYIAGGGYAKTSTQLGTLKNVVNRLQSGKENLSGPILSMAPERTRMKSVAVQQEIEKTIQSSLRETLGAQFTEKEGENLMKRSFDPRLSEKENAKRVSTIIGELEMMARAKNEAANYYQKNGTMVGYTGKIYTFKDGNMVEVGAPDSATPSNDPMGLGI